MKRRYLEPPVVKTLREVLPRNSKLLLAISGGVDSVALGLGCQELKDELGLSLAVAHFDHKLRPDSLDDADFVVRWCERLGVSVHVGIPASLPPSANIESWAREERYGFLASVRDRLGMEWVLTAHHRDDLLETTLVQLLQNREPRGIVASDHRRRVIRPLLGVTRSEIVAYVTGRGEVWREVLYLIVPSYLKCR